MGGAALEVTAPAAPAAVRIFTSRAAAGTPICRARLFLGKYILWVVGDGSIIIYAIVPVPEPSTWAMTLDGFAGLGWLAQMRGRKTSVA
jgi:hypothetical protein